MLGAAEIMTDNNLRDISYCCRIATDMTSVRLSVTLLHCDRIVQQKWKCANDIVVYLHAKIDQDALQGNILRSLTSLRKTSGVWNDGVLHVGDNNQKTSMSRYLSTC